VAVAVPRRTVVEELARGEDRCVLERPIGRTCLSLSSRYIQCNHGNDRRNTRGIPDCVSVLKMNRGVNWETLNSHG